MIMGMGNHLIAMVVLCLGVLGAESVPGKKTFEGKTYSLTFDDEFDGSEIDFSKWEHRGIGPSAVHKQIWTKDGAYLDGKGNLVMLLYTVDKSSLGLAESNARIFPGKWVPHTAMLRTKKEFTFGYHEVRFTMPIVKGVGMSVWMQSRGNTKPNPSPDPKAGAEIDLIEQTFFDKYRAPVDFKHSTIHWGGYGATHSWVSIDVRSKSEKPAEDPGQAAELNLVKAQQSQNGNVNEQRSYFGDKIDFRDGKFHTVAVLWTDKFYRFFYDGVVIGQIDIGVSEFPGYMILWPRLFDFAKHVADSEQGLGDREKTEAKFLVDYYRVYQIDSGDKK